MNSVFQVSGPLPRILNTLYPWVVPNLHERGLPDLCVGGAHPPSTNSSFNTVPGWCPEPVRLRIEGLGRDRVCLRHDVRRLRLRRSYGV